jgi:crossover junction endodeoxyribonuclease RusA
MTEAAFQSAVDAGAFHGMHVPPRVVVLPWPDSKLSPNSRGKHWGRGAAAKKVAREVGFALTREAFGPVKPKWEGARLAITFCPPDRRRRDDDNAIGAFKAYRDGIADAIGVNDHKFNCTYAFGEPVKGGSVRVEIRSI